MVVHDRRNTYAKAEHPPVVLRSLLRVAFEHTHTHTKLSTAKGNRLMVLDREREKPRHVAFRSIPVFIMLLMCISLCISVASECPIRPIKIHTHTHIKYLNILIQMRVLLV